MAAAADSNRRFFSARIIQPDNATVLQVWGVARTEKQFRDAMCLECAVIEPWSHTEKRAAMTDEFQAMADELEEIQKQENPELTE